MSDKSHLLINRKTLTTEEADMWTAYLPDASAMECGRLVFFLPEGVSLGAIRVWNYNRSLLDAAKGVREARVVLGGKEVWRGEMIKACGDVMVDYTTTIVTAGRGVDTSGTDVLSLEKLPALPFKPPLQHSVSAEADVSAVRTSAAGMEQDGVTPEEEPRAGGGGSGGGPPWLAGGAGEGRSLGGISPMNSTVTGLLSSGGRVKFKCDLDDPDMLPAGLGRVHVRECVLLVCHWCVPHVCVDASLGAHEWQAKAVARPTSISRCRQY